MRIEQDYLNYLGHLALNDKLPFVNTRGVRTRTLLGTILQHQFEEVEENVYTFPLLTTRKLYWPGIVGETIWFLRGESHTQFLRKNKIYFWEPWVKNEGTGELGPIYGVQWDRQIEKLLVDLKKKDHSRRLLVNAWNPEELHEMVLPPCHFAFQLFQESEEKLSLIFFQRSLDFPVGVPFNIAGYALLLLFFAKEVGLKPGSVTQLGSIAHIYENQVTAARIQLGRSPRPLPLFDLNKCDYDFKRRKEIELKGSIDALKNYDPHEKLFYEVTI